MKKTDIVLIGLMLFALFFGAGNLIFPPYLGMEAGSSFLPAITGFIITGVSLPFLAVLAIALSKDGITSIGSRVHPLFGLMFAVLIYLAIGPFFGIPRGASVAFEMGAAPFFDGESRLVLFVFTAFFFALVYVLSLNPSRLVDMIGQFLTPVLLLAIAALCVAAFFQFDHPAGDTAEKYAEAPFTAGFIEGYLTMDTIAALAFGIVVINSLRSKGITGQKEILRYTGIAGLIAAAGLAVVYGSIGWIGVHMPGAEQFNNGAAILTAASSALFGSFGKLLLGIIVALACLTTCIGLTSACAQFFEEKQPALSYKTYVGLFTVISFLIANLGLSTIISVSVPILVMLYPFAIVLIILSLLQPLIGQSRFMYAGAMILTAVYSLYDGAAAFGLNTGPLAQWIGWVPFFESGLGWVFPAAAGALAGKLIKPK
ncbi:branched-chain amino acid transport system II carrier protein [Domibacillus indicus]|uniref:branched-chain amino acid transport system II carrier protein n=1 Tax=Domibacillus indicus TaxID=1437523 RepID=UPI000617EC8C|nr:branched-chain amino acid transport system II carrier protein [Domibacillus indicus]